MAGANFLRVTCNDCGNEAVVFSRASSVISCPVCGSTLAVPKGDKADLVGSSLVETLE